MGFTTTIFLYVFFPLSVLACGAGAALSAKLASKEARADSSCLLRRIRWRDLLMILFSLAFYGWARVWDAPKLCLYILLVYGFGRLIQRFHGRCLLGLEVSADGEPSLAHATLHTVSVAKVVLTVGVAVLLLILFYFKYFNFSIRTVGFLLRTSYPERTILAPLGISFITFSAISYLADIYLGKAQAGGLTDCALYLLFFPKIVSGPIVLWRDFQPQIPLCPMTMKNAVAGVNRIMIGFAKKLILADMFGACIADVTQVGAGGIDRVSAWGCVLLYMLQIYYDFAGYSDIALGLAKLLGFTFQENFRFPYRSKSIGEFWRRWHISLGSWFREYIYFPLGGNQHSLNRTLRNLAVVFLITGIWHGAGWNYILWGCINGLCVLLERVIRDRPLYKRTPDALKWLCTMGITMMCWELFRFENMRALGAWIGLMFGPAFPAQITFTWQYYFDLRMIVLIGIGIVGATVMGEERIGTVYRKFAETKVGFAVQEFGLLALFVISILCMVTSTYSPFIYFKY